MAHVAGGGKRREPRASSLDGSFPSHEKTHQPMDLRGITGADRNTELPET